MTFYTCMTLEPALPAKLYCRFLNTCLSHFWLTNAMINREENFGKNKVNEQFEHSTRLLLWRDIFSISLLSSFYNVQIDLLE